MWAASVHWKDTVSSSYCMYHCAFHDCPAVHVRTQRRHVLMDPRFQESCDSFRWTGECVQNEISVSARRTLSMYNGPEQACRRDTYAAGLKHSPVSVKGTHHLQQARCLGDRREPTNVIGSRPHEH